MIGTLPTLRYFSANSPTPPGSSIGGAPSLPRSVTELPVLIVEDEAVIAWMLEDILETLGFTSIAIVESYASAIEAAGRMAPGLIVSDINLGAGSPDGVATAVEIAGGKPVPVLFITGHASAENQQRIERELMHARMLRKPVARADLARAIAELTGAASMN